MADTPSYEERIEKQFDALLKKVLRDEKSDFMRELRWRMKNQTLFSELDDDQLLSIEDAGAAEAFTDAETEFQFNQYTVAVNDALLYDALSRIDKKARDTILMAFWLDMTDQEIADETGLKRRTVNYIRNKAYLKTKKHTGG